MLDDFVRYGADRVERRLSFTLNRPMRSALRIGLLVSAALLAWRLTVFANRDFWGNWPAAVLGAGISGGLYICIGLLVALVIYAVGRRPRVGGVGAVILSVALLSAVPVDFSYDDGCNTHDTTTAVGLVPILTIAHPTRATLSYEDAATLVLCSWST